MQNLAREARLCSHRCRCNFVVTANAEILKQQNLVGESGEGEGKRSASS